MKFDRQGIRFIAFVFGLLFLVVFARLWQLQVMRGAELRKASEENRLRAYPVFAPRGIIYDRNGTPLVKNAPNFTVSLLPEMAQKADMPRIAALLGITPAEIMERLKAARNTIEPVTLREELGFDELVQVEARLSDFPELVVEADISRHYPYGEAAAHLIGYIGKLTEDQVKDPGYADLPRNGYAGQWGLEKLYDGHLRGQAGKRLIEVDALGRELRMVGEIPPRKGNDLTLALDLNLQLAAETGFGNKVGAMVALNPDTGELLGMVSRPAFDPNLFVPTIKPADWREIALGPKHPLLNRAFQSAYPPGSTFKMLVAMAALETGGFKPDEKVVCRGGYYLGSRRFGCWKKEGHGAVDAHKAIVESCDVYFYNAGLRAGVDRIAEYARAFGLGRKTDIKLGSERSGLIPDTLWKASARNQKWYPGETLNVSIGQGYVLATPLQMARMAGGIGSGAMFLPDIVFTKYEGGRVSGKEISVSLKEATLELVKKAMFGVANEPGGTASWFAKSRVVPIAGKTGTAQVTSSIHGPDHAWFVAYAPSDKPEVALAVLVEEGGHGSSAASPIAKKAIEAYFMAKGAIQNGTPYKIEDGVVKLLDEGIKNSVQPGVANAPRAGLLNATRAGIGNSTGNIDPAGIQNATRPGGAVNAVRHGTGDGVARPQPGVRNATSVKIANSPGAGIHNGTGGGIANLPAGGPGNRGTSSQGTSPPVPAPKKKPVLKKEILNGTAPDGLKNVPQVTITNTVRNTGEDNTPDADRQTLHTEF